MARSVGDEVPEAIRLLLTGEEVGALEGVTFHLLTTTEDGWPHAAMLSVGELLSTGARTLRLALWPNSTATRNLTRTGQTTIGAVHEGAAYYLRCHARRGSDLELPESRGQLAYFELEVEEALADDVPYAELTSGVAFRLLDPERVLAHWRETVEALRAREAADGA